MVNKLVIGDRLLCRVSVGPDQFEWCKAQVIGVREENFDVQFDEPAGPMRVGAGLYHVHHENEAWRLDDSHSPEPEVSEEKVEAPPEKEDPPES